MVIEDYGHGYGKQTYVYEEHEEDYESDYDGYGDRRYTNHHSSLKLKPSRHKVYEEGWRNGEHEVHHYHGQHHLGGGGWSNENVRQPVGGWREHERQRPVGGWPAPVVHRHSEWQSPDSYYDEHPPAKEYGPVWSGHKLAVSEVPARKVYARPGFKNATWTEKKLDD